MEKTKFIYWQDDDMWIGYLEEHPDYMTQGKTIEELKENLIDIYKELNSGNIPWLVINALSRKSKGHRPGSIARIFF